MNNSQLLDELMFSLWNDQAETEISYNKIIQICSTFFGKVKHVVSSLSSTILSKANSNLFLKQFY